MRRAALVVLGVCGAIAPALPAAAQLPEAEEAFRGGRYGTARSKYEQVLARDSLNVRALFRLAIMDGWDGRTRQALERFARLRRLEPRDADIMVAQARVLSWGGRYRESEALFDSVLARSPGRADALAGRARAVAWSGDLDRAERLWLAALELHPNDPETLVGVAQTLFWKGQLALAEIYVADARELAPEDRSARDLERALRSALGPALSSSADYARDSDDNAFFAQEGAFTASAGSRLRVTAHAGWRRATDPVRAGTSYGGGGYLIAGIGKGAVLRAGLGARRLEPENALPRTSLTAQLGVGFRPARSASIGVAYSRNPFDETAFLIKQGFVVDAFDLTVDFTGGPRLSFSGGGGGALISDGNRRVSGSAAVMVSVLPGLQIGGFGRLMGYREPNPGRGYFAPDRFAVLEGRAVYNWRKGPWGMRADGGLGMQQVGRGADSQSEWHAGLAITRGWGANSELALAGSVTNSAASSATGAFRYWTLGLRLRQGL